MNLLKWFSFGSDAAKEVLDGSIRGIDALVFTDEEKSIARQKLVDQWVELQKSLGEETTIRAATRRILAILIILPYTMLVVGAAVVFAFSEGYAKFLVDLAQGQFGLLALGVATFYFGPYMFGQYIKKSQPTGK